MIYGVKILHDLGYAHLDIKPANFLISCVDETKKLEEIISVEVKKYISEELGNFINNAKNMVVDEMKQEMRIKIKNSLRKLCQENTSLNPTSTPDPNEDIILTEEEVQIYEYLKNTILTNNLPINFDNIDESCEKLIEFLLNN